MTVYDPNVPTGLINLPVDVVNIQQNFQQVNTTFSVDHVPLTDTKKPGYHTVIHLIQRTDYDFNSQVGNLIAHNDIRSDNLVYTSNYKSSNRVSKLTNSTIPSVSGNNFYTFPFTDSPGPTFVLQGGLVSLNSTGSITTVNFNATYLIGRVKILLTMTNSSGTSPVFLNQAFIVAGSITKTGFQVSTNDLSGSDNLYWIAIGS